MGCGVCLKYRGGGYFWFLFFYLVFVSCENDVLFVFVLFWFVSGRFIFSSRFVLFCFWCFSGTLCSVFCLVEIVFCWNVFRPIYKLSDLQVS